MFLLRNTVAFLVLIPMILAAPPRAVPIGQIPADVRMLSPKDLDGYFPFQPPGSQEEWSKRAGEVRQRILVSQGLWPMPSKTPLNAQIYGRVEREDYSIEKVHFESAPGFFVTGNLYRPTKVSSGKVPGVLFAHGHWTDARLSIASEAEVAGEIATGQERFVVGGQSRFQSMCVQLARMGCVVWQWDMLGDSDSQQLSRQLVHSFAKQRPEINTVANWGMFSPQAEAHLQSIMGLQTWNAVRSLDFLLGLPEVDSQRVAITGASGGGTQTMILAGIDPRVTLSFPAVMVSTSMQGGCTCENASLLRIGTGNVEFAALFAPKPQGMTSADDWTKEMSSKGFPELKQLYGLMGAPDKVMLQRGEHFPHNYNAVSRTAFYNWLNRHFKLGFGEPVLEKDYSVSSRKELSVWDEAHPAPKSADPDFERTLLKMWHEDSEQQMTELSANDPGKYRELLRVGWDIVLDRRAEETLGTVAWKLKDKQDKGTWIQMVGLLQNDPRKEELPAVFCHPKNWNGSTVLWLSEAGKDGLYESDGNLRSAVRQLVDGGATVVGLDLLHQGEFLATGQSLTLTPRVRNPREAGAYTFGYSPAVFVHRVHDVLTALSYIRGHEKASRRVGLIALDGTASIAAAARSQAGVAVDRVALYLGAFRFGQVLDLRSVDFLPGGAKYGDIDGLLSFGSAELKSLTTADAGAAATWIVR
ncbi:MAG: acetylxylan esterase [Pedosphaera sp.]|nr:acetylxylan esterase [Pedosphaera sp.]